MLSIYLIPYFLCLVTSQQLISREADYREIVGIDVNGETFLYNGMITKHWVKTQADPVLITKAELNPDDGYLYAVERGSGWVYKKASFSDEFVYVACCATTFTFIDTQVAGLPITVKLIEVDGMTIKAQRYFGDNYLTFDISDIGISIQSIAVVEGVIAAVDDGGRLYIVSLNRGAVSFQDMSSSFTGKFDRITSISAWRAKGKFLATSDAEEAWMSSTDPMSWESFGNGRSCCVQSLFEIPSIESFAEQAFPFCTQVNLEDIPTLSNGNCRVDTQPFGSNIYYPGNDLTAPCIHYINSTTTSLTAQDLLSDYKIVVKAVYEFPASKIGVAFNLLDQDHYDYVYISPGNRKDCYGMGHMTATGAVDRVNLNTGCPGGPPQPGTPFTLEIQTVERQVIVKLDGYTIFSRYPYYENTAAGGLLVWPQSWDDAEVVAYGIGVCYVPTELAYYVVYDSEDGSATMPPTRTPERRTTPRKDADDFMDPAVFDFTTEYSSPGADVTETTRSVPTTTSPTFSSEPYDFDNKIESVANPESLADAGIELLSGGIQYRYLLFREIKGFTAANKACEKMGMNLLIVEDEVQNARIATLMQQEGITSVWLGKFWIDDWVITLNDGTTIDWDNFESPPRTSNAPVFAAIRADGYWDAVEGGNRFSYVCQRAIQVDIDETTDNEVKKLQEPDDDGEIANNFEETLDHPPVIIKGPVNVTASVGDTVTFKCTASSKPPSTVIIVKIDDETLELPSVGDASQLNDESQRVTTIIELEAVTLSDAGKYSCIAQNELGEASASAWLIIDDFDAITVQNTCYLWGDPHIQTFDGKNYNYPGTCTYVVAMDCTASSFWIYALFSECGGSGVSGPSLSAIESITIYARVADGNHTGIELQRGWVINIGAAKLRIGEGMTARHGNLVIKRTAEHVIVTLPNKVIVQWDGLHMAVVKLPGTFGLDKTCGLCGRYNLNPDDDYYMRWGNTDTTDNAMEFGNSWAYPTYYRPCNDVPLEEVDPCDFYPERAVEAELLCVRHLYQVPFTSCHGMVEPATFYENCKRDYCGSEWRRDQNLPLCNALSAYATACDLANRPISSWRSVELCPIDEIKEITKEEGCPWEELEFDFEADEGDGERDIVDAP